MKKILVLNSGSSSLKYQLFNVDGDTYEVVAKGLADRIGIDGSNVVLKVGDNKQTKNVALPTHTEAIKEVLDMLLSGPLGSMAELSAVGHRVVHGGEIFKGSALVNEQVLKDIEDLSELAPLHNPANLLGIKAVESLLPNVPQVVVFDTAFHQTMEKEAFLYALPEELYTKHKIRRYGFHGTSHAYVADEAAKLIGKKGKIITCHLGNGASISAVNEGKCVDTSMGFTPLAGVVMGTRSGDIDPYIPLHIMKTLGKSVDEVNALMNKQSGMLGVCGFSDNRDVETNFLNGEEKATSAMKVYIHNLLKYIGGYIAVLGGVDAIVFTAGVGENGALVRKMVIERLAYLGIKLNEENNNKRGQTLEISTTDSKVKVFVIPTDEELMIAKDTVALAF
ncbi:MAG: acetate kinase [Alphaproteobacteria bacterium]|nr:acetate kinase [Alphaproteobacteria bacterium]MBQ2810950.1 acetate kinase [Alphaproteobacteria bacterium]